MRLSCSVRHVTARLMALALVACGGGDALRRDTVASGMIPLETAESRGSLAVRREAQPSFDAAREALAHHRLDDAEAALTRAMTFFRDEARTAESDAQPALRRVADELETLATRVARGEIRAARLLDGAFARAHAAETALHLTRAHAAIIRRDNVRAGEELLVSIDHIERAAKDARLQTDAAVQAAIADTRSLAIEMVKGMEAVPDEVARVTEEIERAIRRINTSAKQPAAPDSNSKVTPTPCRISPDCVDFADVVLSSRVRRTESL